MAAPNFRPAPSCAQFSCILYGSGVALGVGALRVKPLGDGFCPFV